MRPLFAPSLFGELDEAEALAVGLRDAAPTPSGFASVRPRNMEQVLDALESAVARFTAAGSRHDSLVADRLLTLATTVLAHPAAQFASVRNRARLAAGRVYVFRRDWEAADRAIADLVFRPQTACEDMKSVRAAMLLDREVRPNLLTSEPALAALTMERLLFLLSRFPDGYDCIALLEAFAPPLALMLTNATTRAHVAAASGLAPEVLGALGPALAYLQVRRGWPNRTVSPRQIMFRFKNGRPFRELLGVLIAAARSRSTFALSRRSLEASSVPLRRGTLVTRGMGGAGDIAMMLPGILALARRTGEAVHFAVPRGFLAMLEGIDGVVPLASEDDLPFEDYERWVNFGECPAGRYEAAARPRVTNSRIQIFADALGVSADELGEADALAPFELNNRQRAIRDEIRADAAACGRMVVGVAPFSREEYRRVPALVAVAERLAADWSVLVLHAQQVPSLDAVGLRVARTPDLASLIATIAACDYVLATDTAQLHLAAALGVPTLAVFGPTGGLARAGAHPRVRVLQPWRRCPVMPCWRNEDQACRLTLGQPSACLSDCRRRRSWRSSSNWSRPIPFAPGRSRPC